VFTSQKSLNRVSKFEDYDYLLHHTSHRDRRVCCTSLGEALVALASLNFDAKHFFHTLYNDQDPKKIWGDGVENVEILVPRLSLSRGRVPRRWLTLEAVARAVQKMPELEIMELWSATDGESCIFRYCRRDPIPKLSIESPENVFLRTWVMLGKRTPWYRDKQCRAGCLGTPHFFYKKLDPYFVKGHLSLINHRILKKRLLNETSLEQLKDDWRRSKESPEDSWSHCGRNLDQDAIIIWMNETSSTLHGTHIQSINQSIKTWDI
jgi:hypothetical protein